MPIARALGKAISKSLKKSADDSLKPALSESSDLLLPVSKGVEDVIPSPASEPTGLMASPSKPKAPPLKIYPSVSDSGFYSAAEEAALNLNRKSGSGEGFLNDLYKTPNVKKEEIETIGLDTFLKDKPNVTKQEIEDFVFDNKINVQEVQLRDIVDREKAVIEQSAVDYAQGFITRDEYNDILRSSGKPTKYNKYTLPGGENYRELLLTLPTKTPLDSKTYGVGYTEGSVVRFNTRAEAEAYNQQMYKGKANIFEQDRVGDLSSYNNQADYTSSHWSEPNVLAHIRMNDRVDVDGKKMSLIEEIQSDWHQAGREKGYNTPEKRAAEQKKLDDLVLERQELLERQKQLEELASPYTSQGKDAPTNILDEWNKVSNKLNRLQIEQNNRLGRTFDDTGVPDAPMKDTWYQLAIRKAIKNAIDNGAERVGITTGKTQADRYKKSNYVNKINVSRTNYNDSTYNSLIINVDNRFKVYVDPTTKKVFDFYGNSGVVDPSYYYDKHIDEIFGKDLSNKILNVKETETFEGVDLDIGDSKGMKKYYDEIYPKYLDKFAKKYGSRVKEGKINLHKDLEGFMPRKDMKTETVRYIDITPEMKKEVMERGQLLFAEGGLVPVTSNEGLAPFGVRHSGDSVKGKGWLGAIPNKQGDISTELSAEMQINGKTIEYPLLVPTLTKEEVDYLVSGEPPTQELYDKAESWALSRIKKGKSPFIEQEEIRFPMPSESAKYAKGGDAMYQMKKLFAEGGMMDNSGEVVNGVEVPTGSLRNEVADDIPARLSEGEFVFPADVVRYIGLETLMKLRDKAKQGLSRMEEIGQVGNAEEVSNPDQMFNGEDDENFEANIDEVINEVNTSPQFATGGYVKMSNGGVTAASVPSIVDQKGTGAPSTKFSMKRYTNAAGQTLYVPFMGSEPLLQIPEGYTEGSSKPKETTEEKKEPIKDKAPIGNEGGEGGTQGDGGGGSTGVSGFNFGLEQAGLSALSYGSVLGGLAPYGGLATALGMVATNAAMDQAAVANEAISIANQTGISVSMDANGGLTFGGVPGVTASGIVANENVAAVADDADATGGTTVGHSSDAADAADDADAEGGAANAAAAAAAESGGESSGGEEGGGAGGGAGTSASGDSDSSGGMSDDGSGWAKGGLIKRRKNLKPIMKKRKGLVSRK